jgi:hypothetical protein
VIAWGCILSLYVSLLIFCNANVWKLFLLGLPGQAAIFWWFRMFHPIKKESENG